MLRRTFTASLGSVATAAALLAGSALPAAAWAADLSPEAMVQKVSGDTLASIKADKAMQAGDVNRIIHLVDSKVMPHVDFARMTASTVGPAWRTATPAQKARLEQEFKTLLVRTYSNALTSYKDQTVRYKPTKMQGGDTDVLVRTEIVQSGNKPIQLDYSVERLENNGWKIYDVVVAGVSLVSNYRDTFNQEVRANGVDGLIQMLVNKNKQLESGKK